jgi:hypothetical protein
VNCLRLLGGLLRRVGPVGDTGSMPLAALLAIIGVGLSTMLLPVTVTQIGSTRTQMQWVRALHAAQTGLDVALGRIRAAQNGGVGELDLLPCGPLSGNVQADGGPGFDVEIFYLNADPRGRARDNAWLDANKQTCGAEVTSYALLRSRGTDGNTTRRMWGTYVFRTSNAPVPGGLIHALKTGTNPDLCLDAGSAAPPAGTLVLMQPCSPGAKQQTWAYQTNLYLMLVSSRTGSNPGMCLDAGLPHSLGNWVRLQPCADPTAPRQQWSFNPRANFQGTTDGLTLDEYCLNVLVPESPGSALVLGNDADTSSCNSTAVWGPRQTFAPDNAVGAGPAGPATKQLVNFAQFGRCIDLPQKTNPDWVSVLQCNQAPDPTKIAVNQRWTLPGTPAGHITAEQAGNSKYDAGTYCLTSPGSPDQYVDALLCSASRRDMRWTVRGYTGNYATSYRIEDDYGYCLAAKDEALGDFHNVDLRASKTIVAECSGSGLQKWNAPPDLQPSRFKDVGEM